MVQTSRGRTASLHRAPAGFTALALDGYGLRDLMLTRPANSDSYPVPVRRVATLLHASFRPRLATTPLRFANPSPPSGWVEDFHPQADVHARHTIKRPASDRGGSANSTIHSISSASISGATARGGSSIAVRDDRLGFRVAAGVDLTHCRWGAAELSHGWG